MEKNKKNDKIIKGVLIIAAIITVVGMTYALLNITITGTKNYVVGTNGLKVYLDESKNLSDVVGEYVVPVADYQGIQNDSYEFSIVNDEITGMDYSIYLVLNEENTMPSYGMKYNLINDKLDLNKIGKIDDSKDETGRLLYTGNIYAKTRQDFKLKMWLGEHAEMDCDGKVFSAKIQVTAVQNVSSLYVDNVLNGTDPVIGEGMIPVIINDDGSVTKANLYQKWYDYSNSVWANAVILEDNAGEFQDGETIPEEAIESYFVWIPRYKYKIFDEGNYTALGSKENAEQEIEIVFENNETEVSTGSTLGTWLTHPAFTSFDNSNGFWVAKFESGYRGATSTAEAQINGSDASKLVIKPNQYSWRNITVGNAFKTSYDYKRELESHMMKNTEWGAVAYLSHSFYGAKTKTDDGWNIGTSLRINNNTNYVTGYSATEEPTKGYSASSIAGNRQEAKAPGTDGTYTVNYYNTKSIVSSTTGNYSGVYDMSGGAWEYVMGNTNNTAGSSGITSVASDFYTNANWAKYYDKYPNQTSYTVYNNRILGDATGEMGPFFSQTDLDNNVRNKSSWYGDYAYFAYSSSPWFNRGGNSDNGTGSGAFAFYDSPGGVVATFSFRVVLTPQ